MASEKEETTILNVDDDAAARYATSRILRKEGFNVIEAGNGTEALQLVKQAPDLVLLDVNLPDMSGFEVCRMIKENPATALIPVLHLSATYMDDRSKVKGLDTGADGYLTYPLESPVLIAYINSLLRIGQTERKLEEAAQQWRTTFDGIHNHICLLDKELRFLQCNKSLKEFLGKPLSEILGRYCWELIHGTSEPIKGCPMIRMRETLRRESMVLPIGEGWFDIAVDPLLDGDGNLIGAVYIMADVTERRQADEALRESEERYRSLVESTEDSIYLVDRDCGYLFMNKKHLSRFGLALDEVIGRSYGEFHSKKETNEFAKRVNEVFKIGKSLSYEYGSEKDGGYYIRTLSPVKGPDGTMAAVTVDSKDISKRKQAEENLHQSEEKYRSLFEDSKDAVYITTQEGAFIDVNQSALELFGYSRDELEGVNAQQLYVNPLDAREFQKEIEKNGFVRDYEVKLVKKDGTEMDCLFNVSVRRASDGSISAYQGIIRDITKRKQAEEALRESEESYRELADSITDVFFAMDKNLRYTYWNKASEELVGIPAKDAIGKSLFDIFPDTPEIRRAESSYLYVLRTKKPKSLVTEYQQGEKRFFFEISAYPTKDGLSVFTKDITSRKRAEEALRESENRFRALFDHMSSGVAVYEPINDGSDFIIKDYNKAGELISKVSRDHIVGRSVLEVFPGIKKFGLFEVFQRVWKTGEPEHQPVALYQDDYLTHWAENYVYKLPSGEIVAVFDDVTERKQADEELKKSQEQLRNLADHLQSVREQERTSIARKIHDELGQALTALKMDISWLGKKLPNDQESLIKKAKSISTLTDMTIKTVKRITAELRPGLLDDLGLVAAIEWQVEEFQNRTGLTCKSVIDREGIAVDEKRSTTIFRILQEALTNVARHAQATRVTVSLKEKNGGLYLLVRDNGKGITKEQISDPQSFGLMGMRERVRMWGGEVKFSGRPGKGTTVVVRMPVKG
jgi:PAS domain S-box-containing protein